MSCSHGNDFDGRIGLRVSSIFVILVGSALGAIIPIYASRSRSTSNDAKKISSHVFFIARYFGSGVIIATALIHLLVPAFEALGDECLSGPITEYPWPAAIILMSWFAIFIVHVLTSRYENDNGQAEAETSQGMAASSSADFKYQDDPSSADISVASQGQPASFQKQVPAREFRPDEEWSPSRGTDSSLNGDTAFNPDSYAAQMTGLFILEFGVIFHSVFIGLTLSVAGSEFATLYAVLTLHQTFEGIALGARLGSIDWPSSKKWTPYFLAMGYAFSTPLAVAIGLAVRTTFNPESQTTLIVNGVFDSISAGILMYTALVELVAHDFLFSPKMRSTPLREVFSAIGYMMLGALLMAILGKWA